MVVFIISAPSPRLFHSPGLPHIGFPPYTRDESLRVVTRNPLPIFPRSRDEGVENDKGSSLEDDAWVWTRYCSVLWDSLGKGAARDLVSFRNVCQKLWRPFVQPIVDGQFGARDFSRLLVSRRHLLQSDDALVDSIVPKSISKDGNLSAPGKSQGKSLHKPFAQPLQKANANAVTHELPYYTKYILISAYLASYNPARTDPVFFMKAHEKRRRRKPHQTPSKSTNKHRKIPRNLLAPSPFPLERLLAIVHALMPHRVPQTADVLSQIATLVSLRLVLRSGAGDGLDPSVRWKANVGWDFIASLGRSAGLEVRDFVAWAAD
jgi:origin recognition complex subunit 5